MINLHLFEVNRMYCTMYIFYRLNCQIASVKSKMDRAKFLFEFIYICSSLFTAFVPISTVPVSVCVLLCCVSWSRDLTPVTALHKITPNANVYC